MGNVRIKISFFSETFTSAKHYEVESEVSVHAYLRSNGFKGLFTLTANFAANYIFAQVGYFMSLHKHRGVPFSVTR